jgi:hypothetical protein
MSDSDPRAKERDFYDDTDYSELELEQATGDQSRGRHSRFVSTPRPSNNSVKSLSDTGRVRHRLLVNG